MLDYPDWFIPRPPTKFARTAEFGKAIEDLALWASLVPLASVGSTNPGIKNPIWSGAPTAVYVDVRMLLPLLNSGTIGSAEAWQLLIARSDQIGLLRACAPLWAWLRCVAQEGTVGERVPDLVRVPGDPAVVAARRPERDQLLPGLHPTYAPPNLPDAPPLSIRSAAFGPTTLAAPNLTLPDEKYMKTPAFVWRHQWETLMRFAHILEEIGLTAVWWELVEAPKSDRHLIFQAAARHVTRAHQLVELLISNHVLLRVVELDLARDDEETLTYELSIFLLAVLALSEASSSCMATRDWDLFLNGGGTPSMCETAYFFRKLGEQGVPSMKDWQSAEITEERMIALLLTLLLPDHPV